MTQLIGVTPTGLSLVPESTTPTPTASGGLTFVSNRSALAALPVSDAACQLTDSAYEGLFVFVNSNLSAQVTADPGQVNYVAPTTDTSGGSGAWVRTEFLRSSNANLLLGGAVPTGATGGPDLALGPTKIGPVLVPGAYAYSAAIVEGPAVWWDDADCGYHMVYAAYSAGSVGCAGHATSPDLVHWTQDATALLQASGVPGAPDFGGITGPVVVKRNGVYYLFYIGLTAVGYEAGTKTMCLATATSLAGPWTRHGIIIGLGTAGTSSSWRSSAVYHPTIVERYGIFYMFFNAADSSGTEQIGYATSTDLFNWTVQDANCPVLGGGSWHPAITGDPSVYRDGDYWFMDFYGFDGTNASDGIAWTTDEKFPLGWTEYPGNPILTKGATGTYDATYAHKPFIIFKGGVKHHFYTAVGSLGRCCALAIGGPPVAAVTDLLATNMSYGSYDMVTLHTQWNPGDVKTLSYINDASQIVGQVGLGFDGSQTYFSFGHLYNGGYTTTTLFTLAPLGSTLNSTLWIANTSLSNLNMLTLQSEWNINGEKAIVWDSATAGGVVGRVAVGYDGTNCYFTWGALFTGAISTTEAMRLDPNGLNLKLGVYKINGTQVVGARQPNIAAPTGGTTVDTQARTAISSILSLLQTHGLMS